MDFTSLCSNLFHIEAVKFGNFTLKSGVSSPIYVDLRTIISHPDVITSIAENVWQKKLAKGIQADVLCGVPYTALPIATAVAIKNGVPMVMKRKEVKTYGTKKMIEGKLKAGGKCLIIEDIVTSGSSVIETAEALRSAGLIVTDCIVIVNREQGGLRNLLSHGIALHSILTLKDTVSMLCSLKLISDSVFSDVINYIDSSEIEHESKPDVSTFHSHSEAQLHLHPVAKKLSGIMKEKQTNLCVAVDVTKCAELIQLAESLGPHICILKTHVDILEDFNETLISNLRNLAKKHNFLILEDRKFSDIGNTVLLQYTGGVYKIQEWADIVTVHSVPGDSVVQALKNFNSEHRACVLVAQMSSKGALTNKNYSDDTVKIAEKHSDFVIGFISQSRLSTNKFIHICPGINLETAGDSLGQQYKSPEDAILKYGADVVVVGRGITKVSDPVKAAIMYKKRAFKAYIELTESLKIRNLK